MPSGPPSEVQESDEIAMLEGVIIPAINSVSQNGIKQGADFL